MMKRHLRAFAFLSALGCGSAMAQQAGDWVLGAGWLHLSPQDKSSPLRLTAPVQRELTGSGASVGDADTLGLSAVYFIDSHWAVEGIMGIPPKVKLSGIGTLERIGELGSARYWGPAVIFKYYFDEGTARLRPYAGLGATYVWFSDVGLTPDLQNALGSQLRQPPLSTTTTAKIDRRFGAVVNLGLAYQIAPRWGVSFSVSYIPIKTTARLTTTSVVGGFPVAASEASLKLNPIISYLALTYRF